MTLDPNCPFCKKLSDPKEWPASDVVWRFPHSVAVLGQWQQYTGYCILVSREHATELSQLGPNRAAFLDEMAILAEAIEACFHPHKLNYELLGNQVPHLHWHLFPRYVTDPDRQRPVWFALAEADTDTGEKRRLETSPLSRAETLTMLQDWLAANNAPGERGA
ncbi:MAG: HIT family protein [Planctomycetia bacterium]|nr:HIT family protein [Planctomycetia bacterium]